MEKLVRLLRQRAVISGRESAYVCIGNQLVFMLVLVVLVVALLLLLIGLLVLAL